MTRPTVPAHVIAQRGKTITLIDGSSAVVVFTFSSLMRIEDDFGSIAGALAAINENIYGKAFTSVANILASGLEHVERPDEVDLSDVETLRALLDPMKFADYSDAAGEAIKLAFPEVDDDAEAGEGDPDPQQDSLGESGTTSRPSSSDEVSVSSGA